MKVLKFIDSTRLVRAIEPLWFAGRKAAREIMELLCPGLCPVCSRELPDAAETICSDCWQKLRDSLPDPYCPVCGHDSGPYSLIEGRCHRCQNRRPAVSHVLRVGPYQGVLRELILAFKFRRQSHLDLFLGDLLASALQGDPDLQDVDLIVPIPLHWRRRWSRSYNQAELLAHAVARNLKARQRNIPINTDLLRVRYTEPQTSLATSHRLINLRGAFAVRSDVRFEGKHLCLIDDVTTTGTTLRVAAQALKKTGPRRISAAVLAVAAND
jgi:ComF family protein